MSAPALVGMDLGELESLLGPGQPRFRAQQIYDALYRQRVLALDRISNLPKPLRAQLTEEYSLGLPALDQAFVSADGTRRYLFQLADQKTVETVWMPEEERSTVCI